MKKIDEVKTKVKTVWKEHGKGIVIGASALTIGYVAGKYGYSKEIREAVKNLKTFDPDSMSGHSIFNNLNAAMARSNYAAVPYGGCGQTLDSVFDTMHKYYNTEGINLDTEITGAILFLNKE